MKVNKPQPLSTKLFSVSLSIDYASVSTRRASSPPNRHLKIRALVHIETPENPIPLQKPRNTRPWLPIDLRQLS
jgi:hypothetical protein